jgi:ketosteroid isomerase-like protein
MTAPTTTHMLDVDRLRRDPDSLGALLADDVEWIEVDQRTQPHAPAVLHGRDAVLAMLAEAHARGIVSRVSDGFAHSARAAITVSCAYPGGGGQVLCNALVDVREGKIARWFGVQAWDD